MMDGINGINRIDTMDGAGMAEKTPEPGRKKRAGFMRNRGEGTLNGKRKMAERSRRVNRK